MKFKDLTIVEQMDFAMRQVIVHSIIYYDMDENVISDVLYDKKMKYLEKLINENRDKIQDCYYYECMKNFTSATGFDLQYKLSDEHREYLKQIANNVVRLYKKKY